MRIDGLRMAAILACTATLVLLGPSPVHADTWPAKGPVREGNALHFPHHGLRWSLPSDAGWKWIHPAQDESIPTGELVRCLAETDDHNLWCSLHVTAEKRWSDVEHGVQDPKFLATLGQGMLESADSARTRTEVGVPIGNLRGGVVHMFGTFRGEPAAWSRYEAYLRGERFTWQVLVGGTEECESACAGMVEDLLEGVGFEDPTPWIVGPCSIEGTWSTDRPQAQDLGEEARLEGEGFKATKPAGMTSVPVNRGEAGSSLRFAWEARSEDRRAYLYFDLRTVSKRGVSRVKDYARRQMVLRADHWKVKVADADVAPRGGDMVFKTKWGRTRCLGYEFRGTLNREPFVELGYIFKKKKHWYWIRTQHGGENARERMQDLDEALLRCLKL